MNQTPVAVYTSTGYPEGGSVENFVRMLCLGLNANDVSVELVLVRGNISQNSCVKSSSRINVRNLFFKKRVDHDIVNLIETVFIFFILHFAILHDCLIKRIRIYILYGLEYPYYTFPFLLLRMIGVKAIRIVTDDYEHGTIAPSLWKEPKWWLYKLQKKIDKYLNGIVFVSYYLQKSALEVGMDSKKCTVIPHFIDVDGPVKSSRRPSDFKIIGYCGTFSKQNGYEDLLCAYRILIKEYPKLKLRLIGEPGIEGRSYIDSYFKDLLADITITGFLRKNEVEVELSNCDILVNPRKSSRVSEAGFPTKLGEYFSAKVPVVATKIGDINQYFIDGKEMVLVEPDNPKDLARGIKKILDDCELAAYIAVQGYRWAENNVDYRTSALKMTKFIELI